MGVKITRLFRNSDRVTDINTSNINQDNTSNHRSRNSSHRSRNSIHRYRSSSHRSRNSSHIYRSSSHRSRNLRRRSELRISHTSGSRIHQTVERSRQNIINERIASRNQSINMARMRSKQNEIIKCKHLSKKNKYAVTNYTFECCVCYTDKINRKKFLKCNHSLCYKCYDKIILPKKCPLCRLSI